MGTRAVVSQLVMLFICLCILSSGAMGATSDSHRWKFATLAPDGVGWAGQVKKILLPALHDLSDGAILPKVYWGGVMGDDEDCVRKMRIGQLQGAGLSGQGATMACPEMAVVELPFLFNGYDEVDHIKETLHASFDKIWTQNGYWVLLWADQDFDQIYSSGQKMGCVEDFSKAKILTWYGPLEENLFARLGASPIPINVPEVAASLRQGIIDTVIGPSIWMVGAQMYTVVKYVNPIKIRYSPAMIVVTLDAWKKLPKPYQQNLIDARRDLEARFDAGVRCDGQKCLSAMIKYGVEHVKMDPESMKELHDKSVPLWDEMAGTLYPASILEEIQASLLEYRTTMRKN